MAQILSQLLRFWYRRRDVSGPHGERVPVDVVKEGGAMFSQAVDELTGQGGGELEELIGIEERSHCGVQTNREQNKQTDRVLKPSNFQNINRNNTKNVNK